MTARSLKGQTVSAQKPTAAAASVASNASPEVHADGSVTFRYVNAAAKTVSVAVEGGTQTLPMVLGSDGTWTLTTTLQPEIYGYHFMVDGHGLNDPANPSIRPNLLATTTVVQVPGTPPRLWERTDIPHGEIHHHYYHSRLANEDRDIFVYTPPGYASTRRQPYPVLYLLHGYSDDASGWVAAGQANFILDRLIADGKIEPMVVVMPLSYGTMEMIQAGWGVWNGQDDLLRRNQVAFTDQLIGEILPLAEASYNIARKPAGRAVAGLSMGGGESLYAGLNHPDIFGYVGGFSSAVVTSFDTDYAGRSKAVLHLLWVSCGTEDGLHADNMRFGTWAKANVKGTVTIGDTPGMHTWMVWRENLIAFTPLLFHEK